ncbi:oocyte zinc finger protein XlCOF6-like [Bradysia coprophila]|uniref:oocyte zinc finger protein XlCOF6-like n=1 Tax=Bradysia coprophila TaxID=38358 RepID=UPI00187DA15A|nr:oocyte zinc finger protein XlCOF6-like [Bradysia coprophila]
MLRIYKIEVKAEPELTIIDDGRFNDLVKPMQNYDRSKEQLFCANNVKEENFVRNIVPGGLEVTDVIVKLKQENKLNIFDEYENIPAVVYDTHQLLGLGQLDCIQQNTESDCTVGSTTTTSPSSAPALQESVLLQNSVADDVSSFECYLCHQMFYDDSDCRRHMFLCCFSPFVCRICDKNLQSRAELHRHLTHHIEKGLCRKKPNQIASTTTNKFRIVKLVDCLKVNDGKSTNDRRHACNYSDCNATFFTAKALSMHRLIHSDQRKYVCAHEQCGKKFKLRSYLREHENIHKADAKRHKCEYANCDKAFFKKSKLTRHHITHMSARQYSCDYSQCEKKFKDKTALNRHFATHSDRIHACTFTQCEKRFTSKALLKSHVARHINDRPHTCTHPGCGKKFQDYPNFVRHKKGHDVVERPRPFVCPVPQCGKSFAFKQVLKRHSSSHLVDRSYECDQCGKKFKCKEYLRLHKRTHMTTRPHTCNYEECGKSFKSKPELKSHMTVHMDQRSSLIQNVINHSKPVKHFVFTKLLIHSSDNTLVHM